MTAPKLVLHPIDADSAPPLTFILRPLEELRVLGASFMLDGCEHFRAGPEFLAHVVFLGCAPHIELEPPEQAADAAARAGRFCHLRLPPVAPKARIRLQTGRWPRCRHCRSDIDPTEGADHERACPGCGRPIQPEGLNWRQTGGMARVFLDVYGVHPAEAVPSDGLLDALEYATGTRWTFFYIED